MDQTGVVVRVPGQDGPADEERAQQPDQQQRDERADDGHGGAGRQSVAGVEGDQHDGARPDHRDDQGIGALQDHAAG